MTSAAPAIPPRSCSPNNAVTTAATNTLKFRDMILSKFAQNHAAAIVQATNNLDNNVTVNHSPKITEENHSAQLV